MTPTEHNDGRWLTVRWEETSRGQGMLAGWYVVRVCPCHDGQRVTLPLESEAEAQRVRRVILGLEPGRRRSPEREWAVEPERPTTVVPGQVWRRNRGRDARYFQVVDVRRQKVQIVSLERAENGQGWVRAGQPYHRLIALRRLLRPQSCGTWPYTWIE